MLTKSALVGPARILKVLAFREAFDNADEKLVKFLLFLIPVYVQTLLCHRRFSLTVLTQNILRYVMHDFNIRDFSFIITHPCVLF